MLITTGVSSKRFNAIMFQRAKVQKMNANHNNRMRELNYIDNVSKSKSTKNEC